MKAPKEGVLRLLRTARGQLEGILKMVGEDRYCLDISNQILAVQAVLTKANREILHAHLEHCVRESLGGGDSRQKVEELLALLDKLMK